MKKKAAVKKRSTEKSHSSAIELKSLLPGLHKAGVLVFDTETLKTVSSDWTRLPGEAAAAAFPRSIEETQTILAACFEARIPVVPSGGRTGLSGGAVGNPGCLILSLAKLNKVHAVDPLTRTVRVEAGAVTEAVHEHCRKVGLFWPVDLASKGSCTVGGNLSTNAGGVRVVRYGMSRRWVVSAKVLTVQGELLDLCAGLEKDNVGYNLLQLIVGSEGTLGVIVEATLKLVPISDPKAKRVFLFAVSSLSNVFELFHGVRAHRFDVGAFEFFSDKCLQAVEKHQNKILPLSQRGAFYLLMEADSYTDPSDWLADLVERDVVLDGIRAESESQAASLWAFRETITESLGRTAQLKKFDLSLPFHRQAEFLERMDSLNDEKKWKLNLYFFGHFGDGSPHINVLRPEGVSEEKFLADAKLFEDALVKALLEFGGSLSAEHGVGLIRRDWLELRRSEPEKRLYRAIKAAFDPQGLLNPGKVLFT